MRGILTMRALVIGSSLALVAACSGTSRGPSKANGQTVTLTGCLQPGDQPNTYLLRIPGSPIAGGTGGGAVGTTGGAGDQSGTGTAPNSNATGASTVHTYRLVAADPKVNLDMNQGTMVSVTGVLENRSGNGAVGTSGSGQNQAVGTSGSSQPGNGQSGEQASDASSGTGSQRGQSAREGAKGSSPQAGSGNEPAERQQGSATGNAGAGAGGELVSVTAVHRVSGGCSGQKQ